MIQGIFYARFLPQQGTRVVAQSPPGCIVPAPGVDKACLFDFDLVQHYIIPKKAFFNRYVTANEPESKYSVLGFPVCIKNPKYDRNEFIFNFGLVVPADVDHMPYERVVRRLAVTFSEMEKQTEYLSHDERDSAALRGPHDSRRPIESLLEIIKEDLNNYGECMIPVDDANTINMKLFPHHTNPPEVKDWHVPVSKMKFADVVDPTWDLTLRRVIEKIDGVSDVRRIAWAADVSLDLAKVALRHLLYYDTILLLDMFFFSNCYAPRPAIHDFIANRNGVVDECAAYVSVGAGAGDREGRRLQNFVLIKLMTTFCVGRSVFEWLKGHMDAGIEVLRYVDVRRLVQFGVIKGYLYRVHKYIVSKQYLAALATGQSAPAEGGDPLQKYLDGQHRFDEIISREDLTDSEIIERLKAFCSPGDLAMLYR